MRRLFALAVGILHLGLLWLLVAGERSKPRLPVDTRVYASLWIAPDEPQAPPPLRVTPPSQVEVTSDAPSSPIDPAVEPLTQLETPAGILPSTAPVDIPAISPISIPKVDWRVEAIAAAARAARKPDASQRENFSAPPESTSKPCVSRKSSMEWNGNEDRRITFSGPLPVIKLGKRCAVTIGMIGCSLGVVPEPNSHLLDDMRRPDRARSSVPDPDTCD
jgi:hypothetical protein